jgi:predicted nucleic acid-binding protein
MAIAFCRGWIFASDDGATRRFAQNQGIRLTGTLGILIKATTIGLLDRSEADTIHAQMVDEGYRSPLAYDGGISSFLNRPPN